MGDWFTPACQVPAPEAGTAVSIICAVLTALLIAVIGLGFGPLRAWLGPPPSQAPSPGRSAGRDEGGWDEGLLEIWQLDRQLRRTRRAHDAVSTPGLRPPTVRDSA